MTTDRVLWNHGRKTVDEIVVNGCDVSLEQMDDNMYCLQIRKGEGQTIALNFWSKRRIRVDLEVGRWEWGADEEHEEGGR